MEDFKAIFILVLDAFPPKLWKEFPGSGFRIEISPDVDLECSESALRDGYISPSAAESALSLGNWFGPDNHVSDDWK